MEIEARVHDRILKPVSKVFPAVIDPSKMSHYFISSGSGPMKTGAKVEWEFADVGAKVEIEVLEVEENRRVVFQPSHGGATRTTIQFQPDGSDATVVTITEAKFPMDEQGVKRAMGQTAGWTYFLACLKAYLHFGVNLRRGLKESLTA